MINAEFIIIEKFGKFIPTDVSAIEILVFITLVGMLAYGMNKLLSNTKYENSTVVKLINKIF